MLAFASTDIIQGCHSVYQFEWNRYSGRVEFHFTAVIYGCNRKHSLTIQRRIETGIFCTVALIRLFILQFIVDDKGGVAIGCFGLPFQSQEDDVERAVHAAMKINEYKSCETPELNTN